jgi:uncharacterized membrane protein
MPIRNPMEWFVAQFSAPTVLGSAPPEKYWSATHAASSPVVQKIGIPDLREALRRGLHDFAAARTDVVFMCLIYPVLGLFIAVSESRGILLPLLFPTASGFALVGPLFATGLYEMSRQRELTGKISWLDTFRVIRSPQIFAIISLGLLLVGVFLTWLAVAQMIYDFTIGPLPPPSIGWFLRIILTTPAGWTMIGTGLAVGLIFAVAVLAISVVSFPLLLDRKVSFATAIATSRSAVQHNPVPLAIWGLIVAGGLLLGSLPCFIGLVVVLPVLGHSTWHLYRKLIRH